MGNLEETEQQLVMRLSQPPDEAFEELRQRYQHRKELQTFLDNIPAKSEQASGWLEKHKESQPADQGDSEDEW